MRLIDADALDRMGYVLTRTYQQDKETMVYETKKLSDVPSAQPERGHWFNPLGDFTPYRCSRCGHYSDSKTPFCAHCGAAMREEKNVHYDNHSS